MGSTVAGFPRELLNQPWSVRIHHFQTYQWRIRGWSQFATLC